MNVTSLVRWRAELVPGEPFRVPAQWIVRHSGDFWGSPMHVVEVIDAEIPMVDGCLFTYSLTPENEHLAGHWVYRATPGDMYAWADDDTQSTVHHRYLGTYRVWGLTPNDWQIGTLGFTPRVSVQDR